MRLYIYDIVLPAVYVINFGVLLTKSFRLELAMTTKFCPRNRDLYYLVMADKRPDNNIVTVMVYARISLKALMLIQVANIHLYNLERIRQPLNSLFICMHLEVEDHNAQYVGVLDEHEELIIIEECAGHILWSVVY